MSNPLRSAGVRELETVTLYAVVYGGSENVFYIIYRYTTQWEFLNTIYIHVYTLTDFVFMDNTYPVI